MSSVPHAAPRPAQTRPDTAQVLKELQRIPGVGKSVAADLLRLGFTRVAELAGQDPEALYERLRALQQCRVDRCMLYVLRCAVYFAERTEHDPKLLKWWNWKDAPASKPEKPSKTETSP